MPLSPISAVALIEELLVIFNCPVAVPAVKGSNCRFNASVCPGFNVTGKVIPDKLNSAPVVVAAVTITGAVPTDTNVTDWVADVLTRTHPKATLVALTLRVGPAAFEGPPATLLLRTKKDPQPERTPLQIAIASRLIQHWL